MQGEAKFGTWEPMETAPRDGRKILAWDGDWVIVAMAPDGSFWGDEFQEYLTLDRWTPLPPPPATEEG